MQVFEIARESEGEKKVDCMLTKEGRRAPLDLIPNLTHFLDGPLAGYVFKQSINTVSCNKPI